LLCFSLDRNSMVSLEKAILRESQVVLYRPGRCVVAEEGLAETFRLPASDHAASARGHRHRAGTTKYLQLYRRALHAGDAQRNPTIVNLVVAELLQQGVADLCQAQSLLSLDYQRHDVDPVKRHGTHLQLLSV